MPSVSAKDIRKEIREELRMTVAMRCYCILCSGGAKCLNQQWNTMSKLFHGEEPTIASQVKLICNAAHKYKELYDVYEEDTIVTNSDVDTVPGINAPGLQKYVLKSSLSRDATHNYFAGIDIISTDLEKKSRNSSILSSGRTLLELAERGLAHYCKALTFAAKKFDLDTMTVKESGNTIDDVIEFV